MSCGNNCEGCSCSSERTLTPKDTIESYFSGLAAGIQMFAWWKDGVQYVGTTGKTLNNALEDIKVQKNDAIQRWETFVDSVKD
jgi:hypothetical protein